MPIFFSPLRLLWHYVKTLKNLCKTKSVKNTKHYKQNKIKYIIKRIILYSLRTKDNIHKFETPRLHFRYHLCTEHFVEPSWVIIYNKHASKVQYIKLKILILITNLVPKCRCVMLVYHKLRQWKIERYEIHFKNNNWFVVISRMTSIPTRIVY